MAARSVFLRSSGVIVRALVVTRAHATAGLRFLRGPEPVPDIDDGEQNNREHDDGLVVHVRLLLLLFSCWDRQAPTSLLPTW